MKTIIAIILLLFAPVEMYAQTSEFSTKLYITSDKAALSANGESAFTRRAGRQHINILALRVEFQQDDDVQTTGDGKFDYSAPGLPPDSQVDPPPHDRAYFLDHLEALNRYYNKVSSGNVTISYSLFPAGDREAYTLPEVMSYYNPNTTDEVLDMRLSELFRSAVESADVDPGIVLADYGAVVIFHAGSGSDFLLEEQALDPTPYDLPSVYLNLSHLKRTIGNNDPDYKGIPVDGGADYISECIILPETESKRGVGIGLNGIFAHQFGHYLGLPSLFNTASGRPAIGQWGLMGVGFANVDDLIPAEPSAWSKVYMKWEIPVIVESGTGLGVAASRSNTGNKIYKIPITPTEYYLVENRQTDYTGDGLKVTQTPSGVIIEADDYDGGIPGSGMLIWHIDERVIAEGLEDNSVNANPVKRGVDLEEADGSQDIGELFPFLLPGSLSPENGLEWDAYYAGNNTEFTPATEPNTLSARRANSHIYITGISAAGPVMTFSVERKKQVSGFPMYLGGDFSGMSPVFLSPANLTSNKIIAQNWTGNIFAINGQNLPLTSNQSTAVRYDSFLDTTIVFVPKFVSIHKMTAFQPLVYESADSAYIVIYTDDQEIRVFSSEDLNADNYADLVSSWSAPSNVWSSATVGNVIITGHEDGYVRLYDINGNMTGEAQVSGDQVNGIAVSAGAAGSFNRLFASSYSGDYGIYDSGMTLLSSGELGLSSVSDFLSDPVMWFETGGDFKIISALTSPLIDDSNEGEGRLFFTGPEEFEYKDAGYKFNFSPASGDINGDGLREIILFGGSIIYAFESNGSLVTGFPIDIHSLGYAGSIYTEPALGDIDGDDKQDILFGTDEGNIYAFDCYGAVIDGFPLPMGSGANLGSLTLLRNTEEDLMELAALDEDGYLYLWNLETTYDNKIIAWETFGGNNKQVRHNTETTAAVPSPPENILMPSDKVYNWPNPTTGNHTNIRFYLNYPAEVNVRIYNQAGDLVGTLSGSGLANVDNEIVWDLSGIESAVYFAEVKATGNGMTVSKIVKIAVIK